MGKKILFTMLVLALSGCMGLDDWGHERGGYKGGGHGHAHVSQPSSR